jgi:hypothetical protein
MVGNLANERQRTSTNVSERQRTSANVSERQRTSANDNEQRRAVVRRCSLLFIVAHLCLPRFS